MKMMTEVKKSKFVVALGVLLAASMPGAAAAAPDKGAITIKGSDTMVHLVSSWAEDYMNKVKDVDISVTGGGSGTGIAALLNGTTDLAAASRDLEEKERTAAKEKGLDLKQYTVARDGLAIIVNPSNSVKEFTLEDLKKIYTGAAKNWKEFGGADSPITILSRESSSGTYVFFQEHVLQKQDYAATARLMPATSAIVQSVAEDKGAIGYVGLGYATDAKNTVKIVPVRKDVSAAAVMPSEETVKAGTYPIARPLFIIAKGPESQVAKNMLDWMMGSEGQEIVRKEGYVSIK